MEIESYETNKNVRKRVEKNFQCENCHKYFAGKKNLSYHIRAIHLGEKNFHCQICEISFLRNCELKSHVLKKHPKDGEVPEIFYCDQCAKQYTEKNNLNQHIKNKHQEKEKNFHCDLW